MSNNLSREINSTHLVDLSNILKRVDLVDLNLERTRLEHTEKLVGVELELLTSLDVAEEGRASNLDTLWREFTI